MLGSGLLPLCFGSIVTVLPIFSAPAYAQLEEVAIELANKVWAVYGGYTGPQLSNLTHMPDTPWDRVYKASPRATIANELIREHFVGLSQSRNAQ